MWGCIAHEWWGEGRGREMEEESKGAGVRISRLHGG